MKLLKSEEAATEHHYRGEGEGRRGEIAAILGSKTWLDYPSSEWTFAEYRVGDESARNDGGFVARVRAHHAGRHEDVEGACHFQPQQRPRPLQFLAKCA